MGGGFLISEGERGENIADGVLIVCCFFVVGRVRGEVYNREGMKISEFVIIR